MSIDSLLDRSFSGNIDGPFCYIKSLKSFAQAKLKSMPLQAPIGPERRRDRADISILSAATNLVAGNPLGSPTNWWAHET